MSLTSAMINSVMLYFIDLRKFKESDYTVRYLSQKIKF